LANEQDFIEPKIDIIEPSDAAIDDLELKIISELFPAMCCNLPVLKKNRKDFHCYPGWNCFERNF
jgi:hypothetical protein